jgi:replication factor C subunit 2/4
MINEMAGVIPDDMMKTLIDSWSSNDIKYIQKVVQDIMNEGYSGEKILSQIHEEIIKSETLDTLQKSNISQYMAVVDINLIQGADEHLQVLNIMTTIADISTK